MKATRIGIVTVVLFWLVACSHPIEIVGEGDVLSATGDRNCYLEDFQAGADSCRVNLVVHAYQETYYAVARENSGWEFSHWENYCTDHVTNECSFNVPAEMIKKNWGVTVPPLIAVFTKKDVPPPPPVAVYSYSIDALGNMLAPMPLKDALLERKTAYFGFRDAMPESISFWCCKVPSGAEPHMPKVADTNAPFVLKVDLGALPDDHGLERELYADIFAPDGSYKGYSTLWRLAAPPTDTVVFDDGKEHLIDYTVLQSVRVTGEGTVMNLYPGADITAGTLANRATSNIYGGTLGDVINSGTINVFGGDIGIIQSDVFGVVNVSGGSISYLSSIFMTTTSISGGEIKSIFAENADISISGGTFFEDIVSIETTRLAIYGGVFFGSIVDDYDGVSSISIAGGDFRSGFRYNQYGPYADNITFTFYGDLSMTKPVEIEDGVYESTITGTLQDGNQLSQKITCYPMNVDPAKLCDGVRIVSSTPVTLTAR